MRLYSFQGRYGHDKVCRTEQQDISAGDLLIGNADMFLALGETVVWKADKAKLLVSEQLNIHHAKFLTKESLELIHRLTNEYYTSYKNTVKLFIPGEIADLFKKEISSAKKIEQSLIVYPDVRTMENLTKIADINDKGIAILNGTSTQVQQDKARWGIKMGHIHTLMCTYSQLFQDWKNLKHITLIDAHQRYYKNQQDPRYDAREVVKKMSDIYKASLNVSGIEVFPQKTEKGIENDLSIV